MTQVEVDELQERVIELEQKNEQLMKERNHFAQKLVSRQMSQEDSASGRPAVVEQVEN